MGTRLDPDGKVFLTLFISTPMALPVGPTLFAAVKTSKPAPDPKSTTVSPFDSQQNETTQDMDTRASLSLASAIGLPQLKPRFAPSGMPASSSSVYPNAFATVCSY